MKKSTPIKAPRCIHIPTKENTVVIFSSKKGKSFEAGFTIGNQDFTVAERGTIEEAHFFCNMLEYAFKALIKKNDSATKSDAVKKMIADMSDPKITVINLR